MDAKHADALLLELRAAVRLGNLLAALIYAHDRKAIPSLASHVLPAIERYVYGSELNVYLP